MRNPDIAVVGSLHYDILVTGGNRPRKGETLFGTAWDWKCGGKGGNQAIEAARHGAMVTFVGAVGHDTFADALLATLQYSKVATDAVARLEKAKSGMSVAVFDPEGDYGAVIVPGANWEITPESIGAAPELKNCRILLLQNEVRPETNLAAARIAKAHGALIILNGAPARELSADLAELLDILIVNEVEAEMLAQQDRVNDMDSAALAAEKLLLSVPAVIVTLGKNGLLISGRNSQPEKIYGHTVQVQSTHGAGDCFIGALSARIVKGDSLASAARYANAAAAVLVATFEKDRGQLTPTDTLLLLENGVDDVTAP